MSNFKEDLSNYTLSELILIKTEVKERRSRELRENVRRNTSTDAPIFSLLASLDLLIIDVQKVINARVDLLLG